MTRPTGIPILTNDGVTLRPLDVDRDLSVLHAIFGDARQMRYMLGAPMESEADTRALVDRWCKDADSPQWAITTDGETALGRITLIAVREGVMEVGLQVAPVHQSGGLARRAIVAVTLHGLGPLRLSRLYADIDPENVGCVRSFERAGYRLEGHLVANWVTKSGAADSLIFAATAGWGTPQWALSTPGEPVRPA